LAIKVKSEVLEELIDPAAEVEEVATGFTFTEGPIWNQHGEFLLFSDMPGDVRLRWSEREGVSEVMRPIVENVKRLAAAARSAGMPVIHVHYIVESGARGLKQNAPLFIGVKDSNAPHPRHSLGSSQPPGLRGTTRSSAPCCQHSPRTRPRSTAATANEARKSEADRWHGAPAAMISL
jgi:hypothetical protein